MPWTEADVPSKTKKATTAKLRRQWVSVANSELAEHGDEAAAIKAANSVIARAVTHGEMAKEAKGK